jgi:hypothetical protein
MMPRLKEGDRIMNVAKNAANTCPGLKAGDRGDVRVLEPLRGVLQGLPLAERSLIALRYGAEMGDEEIGGAMGWHRDAVARRVGIALAHLQRRLRRAGAHHAEQRLNAELLRDAVCGGIAIPSGLRERVIERVRRLAEAEELKGAGTVCRTRTAARVAQAGSNASSVTGGIGGLPERKVHGPSADTIRVVLIMITAGLSAAAIWRLLL